jgi:eukaryotic-like serine/threonine-protein kinase
MSFDQGTVLAGRYRLTERIASGGMGEVWRAADETLDREVAVKVLRPDAADDSGFAERFRAEARHMGALTHPNIGTVHDFGEDGGTAYLVMEFLEGEPLSTIIRDTAPMDPQLASDILFQVASALQSAHDAGVIHRDVKPANIVVDPDGYAKLTDFGISRALSEAPLTQTGEVLGTPHYLSPEQAQGQPAGPLSDVYALAVVGYEMITGERPFAGDSMVTTALAHVSTPAPPLPDDVPEPLRTVVMASLAKDPNQRPQSAEEFAQALRTAPEDLPDGLRRAAASAVAPVIVGVPLTLPPDMPLPTSVISTPEATILTPPGMAPLALGPAGAVAPLTTAQQQPGSDAGQPASNRQVRRLMVAAAVVVVVIVVAAALAYGGNGSSTSGTHGATSPTGTSSATPAVATSSATTTAHSSTTTTSHAQPNNGGQQGKGQGKGKGGKDK